jgi:hypothetical protein
MLALDRRKLTAERRDPGERPNRAVDYAVERDMATACE